MTVRSIPVRRVNVVLLLVLLLATANLAKVQGRDVPICHLWCGEGDVDSYDEQNCNGGTGPETCKITYCTDQIPGSGEECSGSTQRGNCTQGSTYHSCDEGPSPY